MTRRNLISLALIAVLGLGASLARGDGYDQNPLKKARVGQWVFHQVVVPGNETFVYQWVDRIDKSHVIVKSQLCTSDGRWGLAEPTATDVDTDRAFEHPPNERYGPTFEEVIVKGRRLLCKRIETPSADPIRDKSITIRWVSDEVPLYGIVKAFSTDRDQNETWRTQLMDFGDSGGGPRPVTPAQSNTQE